MPDQPGPAATGRDTDFTLSIEDAAQLYANAGHPRTLRTIQRYCATGHLDCMKAATTLGDKYLVTPLSVARHIAQIAELKELEAHTTFRDASRPVATQDMSQPPGDQPRPPAAPQPPTPSVAQQNPSDSIPDTPRPAATTSEIMSRQDATGRAATIDERERLEREADRLRDDVDFLRGQIRTKDEQIAALLERDRETNYLVRGLQQMLAPLLGAPRAEPQAPTPEPRFYSEPPSPTP